MAAEPFTIAPSFFDRIDRVVNQAQKNGLNPIIDFHNFDDLMNDPAANTRRFLALWEQIAGHYQKFPSNLLFELLNEPKGKLDSAAWNSLIGQSLPILRASNPQRNIIIGPANMYSLDMLGQLNLPNDDRHLIISFHYYRPVHFTYQGANWIAGANAWSGTQWTGSPSDKAAVQTDLNKVAKWSKLNDRPIFMGEFGAYSKADMDSRARWTTYVARQAETLGFSWAYWEFCSGFGVYDPQLGQWRQPLLTALIGK